MSMSASQKAFVEKIAAAVSPSDNILKSLTIAQAILESGWGSSGLTQKANNLFGMKKSSDWKGKTVTAATKEYENGKEITINAEFKAYDSWAESVADHSALFNRLSRYANLRGLTDYKLACKYVREDGYATDPAYTTKLLDIIEAYGLMKYDAPKVLTVQGAIAALVSWGVMNSPDYWTAHYKDVRYLDELLIKMAGKLA
ncbi:hypothetical protein FACS189490_02280 [Clostridia bacterium]|nr:hypothetical protein FACS189490_02280 [Clostridia bacterium]